VTSPFSLDVESAAVLDQQDDLAGFRARFYVKPGEIYMDGNSLGLASIDAERELLNALQDWKLHGVEGWTAGDRPWFYLAERLGALQAPLVGALPDEVVVSGTTTVNLHTLVAGFYRPSGRRTKIVAASLDFPSDLYGLQSQLKLHGLDPVQNLVLVPSLDGRTIAESDVIAAMTDEVALVVLPMVLYRSGQFFDIATLTAAAHARGIPIGWDGCHAVGSVPLDLHGWGVDFAYWCSYKYLNGGPGATGALFVNQNHFGRAPGLAGWFGNKKETQFALSPSFDQCTTAGAWQISTPTVFSSAPLLGALQIFGEAGIERLRLKSLRQTAYLIYLIDQVLTPLGFTVGSPREGERRGGHVALEHPEALGISWALRARGVIPDFRPPNIVRLAPMALYNTFTEIRQSVQIIKEIVQQGEHLGFKDRRDAVS